MSWFKFSITALFLLVSGLTFAQKDSTHIKLKLVDPVYLNPGDSLFFPSDLYNGLNLKFKIDHLPSFGRVHIELSAAGSNVVFYKKTYTKAELEGLAMNPSGQVDLQLSNILKDSHYKVAVVIENTDGLRGRSIEKHI